MLIERQNQERELSYLKENHEREIEVLKAEIEKYRYQLKKMTKEEFLKIKDDSLIQQPTDYRR